MRSEIHRAFPFISPLQQFQRNVTSQSGEDGIIEHIMAVLQPANRYCVEFGAHDGRHYSNCHNLVINKGWSGLMIEANPILYPQLVETYRGVERVRTLNRFVEFEGANALDNILTEYGAPAEPGLISIDIDGNDYHVWDSLKNVRPTLLVIEINPTIPNDVLFIQDKSFEVNHGCSLLSLVLLGKEKGYELAACTKFNALFVLAKDAPAIGVHNLSHHNLFVPIQDGRIFQGMDSSIHVVGMDRLLWGDKSLSSDDFQVLGKADQGWNGALNGDRIEALARFDEALTHHQAGRLSEAANSYALAIDLRTDFPEALTNRGTILIAMGYIKEGIACYRRAVALRPDFSEALCGLGIALIRAGSLPEARASLERAVALKPDNEEARKALQSITGTP